MAAIIGIYKIVNPKGRIYVDQGTISRYIKKHNINIKII